MKTNISLAHKYNPGLHKLLTLEVLENNLLIDISSFKNFSIDLIRKHQLEIVGISEHVFLEGGFTMAICLKESHICIHTWPEFNQLTLDIYLCNYLKDNSEKVTLIGNCFKEYFKANVLNETNVYR
ncbi:S-adenosylmethionine decarboxylase [Flavobacterium sp. xlx-214]|uniref:S-adenosylmethionine decarboxylase family protein n=1 Tax=unclassified Flavobacterium TaxID=196869 RepID=UPI0013D4A004|nr:MULTISPECIES: S-adenosylmethionine decarboxylase [unclassified Flavobacterium]MBA5792957.1 S-adenosylmethionine decarboxylase [Flavobacterium sp. xlx-221]QMI84710.1 S-adenosylmethionine decarboxylase [Flavobacterium sp. xlx-214]